MRNMPEKQPQASKGFRLSTPDSCSNQALGSGGYGFNWPYVEDPKRKSALTDYFSKWAEAAALPDKTAHGVASFIYAVSVVI